MVTRVHTAIEGNSQIHFYGKGQSDTTNHVDILDFDLITKYSHGHHARSGGGNDIFNFTRLSNVRDIVSGRLEDFDPSRDEIQIEGVRLDLRNPPDNVRIVEYNGGHNDPGTLPQKYLVIETSGGGTIFYALEGARIDMTGDGGANEGEQERHFLRKSEIADIATLPEVRYIDPENIVPAGYTPQTGGVVINDVDKVRADVLEVIEGTGSGDLIAAGLNDDSVRGGNGNDRIWGGSGNDSVFGGNGNDTIRGGDGQDFLIGGRGNDRLYGGEDNDALNGWGGNDILVGNNGNDRLYGQQGNDIFFGGNGNDTIGGSIGEDRLIGNSGNDRLHGGADKDVATGGRGADLFVFKTGDLVAWRDTSGTRDERFAELDVITDFTIGEDRIRFDGVAEVDTLSDLKAFKYTLDGNVYFTLAVRATGERLLVDVDDDTNWSTFFTSDNIEIL